MKKTYDVEVDCANCAAKMEEAVKNTEGVKNATLSFMTLKLKVAGIQELQSRRRRLRDLFIRRTAFRGCATEAVGVVKEKIDE